MKKYDVLCAGIIVADLFTAPLNRLPQYGELCAVDDITLACGGCAVNVAVNSAKLGLRTTLAGRIGNDYFGSAVVRELQQSGLDTGQIRVSDQLPTSKTVILIVKGEDRRYIHAVGANAEFKADDIDKEKIAASAVFYVGGLFAMRDLDCEQLVPVFRYAREAGTRTVLDVVVPAGSSVGLSGLGKLLPYTDVFLPNEDEGAMLTGTADPLEQARFFKGLGAQCVVVTRGGGGSMALSGEAGIEAKAFPVHVVDSSGSGDAFTSGLIYGLLQGWPLERQLEFASAMGASACRAMGCTTSTFTCKEANDFLQRNRLIMNRC